MTYEEPGSYTAILQVTNAVGMGEASKALEVHGREKPESDFNYTIHPDGKVEFQNLSTDADTYGWYFGDADTSTQVHPVHQYDQPASDFGAPGIEQLLWQQFERKNC